MKTGVAIHCLCFDSLVFVACSFFETVRHVAVAGLELMDVCLPGAGFKGVHYHMAVLGIFKG